MSDDSKSADLELISLRSLSISPNRCPLDSPLNLKFDFSTKIDLKSARWEISYVVDYSSKRHVIEVGKSETLSYSAGAHEYNFAIDRIDVSGVKPSVLLNVGLLKAILFNGDETIVEIKIVTQVNKNKEGQMIRVMFDPMP